MELGDMSTKNLVSAKCYMGTNASCRTRAKSEWDINNEAWVSVNPRSPIRRSLQSKNPISHLPASNRNLNLPNSNLNTTKSSSSSFSFEEAKRSLCFRCGDRFHKAMECRNAIVCHCCGKFGHKKSTCRIWLREMDFFDNPNNCNQDPSRVLAGGDRSRNHPAGGMHGFRGREAGKFHAPQARWSEQFERNWQQKHHGDGSKGPNPHVWWSEQLDLNLQQPQKRPLTADADRPSERLGKFQKMNDDGGSARRIVEPTFEEGILKIPGVTTPAVSNTFDSRGELAAGVASVEAVERFVTPDIIWQFRHTIHNAPVLLVDANLNPQSLEAASKLAAESGVPVWFEPVSVAKATRIVSFAKYITIASPNEYELIAMANALSPREEFCTMQEKLTKMKEKSADLIFNIVKSAIHLLLEKGIKVLVVTLGPYGVIVCFREGADFVRNPLKNRNLICQSHLYKLKDKNNPLKWFTGFLKSGARGLHLYAFHLPALPASVVSLTGAGDCLVGGILASICSGLDLVKSLAVGIAVAKVTVESESNVPAEFSLNEVTDEAWKIFSCTRQLVLD